MRVVDAYCGAGGWSAGAIAAGCTPVVGIDSDAVPLKLWATNCSPAGRAVCATIGADAIDWPDAAADVHVHLSPPCTSLSKARAGSASASSVATALDAVRWCVQLVLDKGYASWSLENVATPAVVACVAELARQHPDRVAHLTLDAADYGVGSNRVRVIASTPAVIRALKEMPVQRVSVAEALAAAGLPLARRIHQVQHLQPRRHAVHAFDATAGLHRHRVAPTYLVHAHGCNGALPHRRRVGGAHGVPAR